MTNFARVLLLAASVSAPFAPAALGADYKAFLAGRHAAQMGDNTRAAAEMLTALAADPARADLQNQAFLLSILAGSPDTTRLVKMMADNPLAALVLADSSARANNWPAAELAYAVLPRAGLTDALRPLLLAWAQAAQGLTDKSLNTLDDAGRGHGQTDALLSINAALIADMAHRDGLANRMYQDIAKALPTPDLGLAVILASWEARNGRPTEAHAIIDALIARSPDLAMARQRLIDSLGTPPVSNARAGIGMAYGMVAGVARTQRSGASVGEILAHLALRVDPTALPPVLLIAETAANRDQRNVAIDLLQRVPAVEPLYPVVQLRIAMLLARTDRQVEALASLEVLAKTYPNQPDTLTAIGDILIDQKKYAGAIDAYTRAIKRVPVPGKTDWSLFYARGAAYERNHEWPRAQADMQQALKIAPNQPFVLNFLGFSMADRNQDLPEARRKIELALKTRPDDGAIIDSLGWVKLRQGDAHGAIEALERAAELQPGDATITGHLGDAYWQVGRKIEAENQWRRALVLKPDEDEQARIEKRLKTVSAQP